MYGTAGWQEEVSTWPKVLQYLAKITPVLVLKYSGTWTRY